MRRWRLARIDAVVAVLCMAAGAVWIWAAQQGATESAMERGHGRDTSAFAILGALIYFPPAVLLFGGASWAACSGKAFYRVLHCAAIAWALAPLVWIAVLRL